LGKNGARIWDTATGDELRDFKGHGAGVGGGVITCAVGPDGTWVVSGADDKKLLVWDTRGLDLPPIARDTPAQESYTRTCVLCGRETLVIAEPCAPADLKMKELATVVGHPCRSCGAFVCSKENKKALGGKKFGPWEEITCPQCGTTDAFPLAYLPA
jgi:hypothetical protein